MSPPTLDYSGPDTHWIEFEIIEIDTAPELHKELIALREANAQLQQQLLALCCQLEQATPSPLGKRRTKQTNTSPRESLVDVLQSKVDELEAALTAAQEAQSASETAAEQLKAELAAWDSKERELQRLRTLMRFSQLKKDSEALIEMRCRAERAELRLAECERALHTEVRDRKPRDSVPEFRGPRAFVTSCEADTAWGGSAQRTTQIPKLATTALTALPQQPATINSSRALPVKLVQDQRRIHSAAVSRRPRRKGGPLLPIVESES